MLDRIIAPIYPQIEHFEERLKQVLTSDISLVHSMAGHLLGNRGKHFRPALSLLTAQAIGGCSERVVDAAVGIEVIHLAALLHDDVIDSAEMRRGAKALNFQWGNHAAVLMGDFLLAKALQVLVGLRSLEVMDAATRATHHLIEGEILEIQNAGETEVAVYFNMIDKKTASLMTLACEVGAILGGGTPEQIAQMSNFGKDVGIAFQITDDLLDFVGDEKTLGKPVGSDVREKKLTLPLLRALHNCQNGESRHIRIKVREGIKTEEDWQEILQFIHRYRGIEEARIEALAYTRSALKNLGGLQGSEARTALELAAQHVVERKQ